MIRRWVLIASAFVGLAACAPPGERTVIGALPPPDRSAAAVTVSGPVGTTEPSSTAQISYGRPQRVAVVPETAPGGVGTVSLDFSDIDIREVVAQILGATLRLTYTIDPAVHGTATLHTSTPLATAQLLPALQALLAQNNATLVEGGGIYRVIPLGSAGATNTAGGATPVLAASGATAGSAVIQLHYASAEDLARALQPYAGAGARLSAAPGANALVVSGDPAVRSALTSLVEAFDVDLLAGQSYVLLPVSTGDAKDFATALQDAFRGQGGLAGVVRAVPMARVNAVLVVSSQPRYIDEARRVYALVERRRRESVRGWHVYYLQNGNTNDVAYVLQQAFTPGAVTAVPSGSGQTAPGAPSQMVGGFGARPGLGTGATTLGLGSGGAAAGATAGTGLGTLGGTVNPGTPAAASGGGPAGGDQAGGLARPDTAATSANPLLGGLDPTAGAGGGAEQERMRIIGNPQNNAILVYGTPREQDTVESMLRKIDIIPLQVRIDATIAEVTLNDQLQYGTQFFFKSGGINGILNTATAALGNPASTVLNTTFPGFVLGGNGQGGAPIALSALQAVTKVHVLSSPQLMVLNNQAARLQVGNLVPYLTSSSQSSLVSGAPVINQVNYQPTGVIMQVTPRVNSGGLVTLDIAQEVSDVDTSRPPSSDIGSPTFLERNITSRIVVQDGQTVGLAGLIQDSTSRANSGIPWLKDIPLIGILAGSQNNKRTRTELLVLITPHVIREARDAHALTEDMRDALINAAAVPYETGNARVSGSSDPNRRLRQRLNLDQ